MDIAKPSIDIPGFIPGLCFVAALSLFNPGQTVAQENKVTIQSTRINDLKTSLKKGDLTAENNFWKELEERGTPIVEHIDGDANYRNITFVLKASPDTLSNAVVKFWSRAFFSHRHFINAGTLVNLSGTNVWFKTIK